MSPGAVPRHSVASGFTIIEVMISAAIFSVVGYTLASAFLMSAGAQQSVSRSAGTNRSLRTSGSLLMDELRASSDAQITVTPLPDGNHQLDLMVPIDVAGVATWGVHDKHLGPTAALQNRQGWTLRYTVQNVAVGAGGVDRQLVRQLIDTAGDAQRQTVIARDLRSGAAVPPGFSVVQVGDVWEVQITTQGEAQGASGRETLFHVRPRN